MMSLRSLSEFAITVPRAQLSPLPRIALTMGDPAGVGPELALKAAQDKLVREWCMPSIWGGANVLRQVAERLDLVMPPVVSPDWFHANGGNEDEVLVVDVERDVLPVIPGKVSAATGRSAFLAIDAAIKAAMARSVVAMVTGPISKAALAMAGFDYPGHTEILAEKTGADRHCMMLTSDEITCSLVTTHIGLEQVSTSLSVNAILETIELSAIALRRMRSREVILAVCGLNPHAGEGGLFGKREEETLIQPAIELARSRGIELIGPLPADTAFLPSMRRRVDGYICMYHDQGLIPLKTLAFDTAVNVTLGLPIVRTSVDHGTALDMAWTGRATSTSMVEAIRLAVQLSL